MKRIVFLFIISVFFCNISAQKITKNEKDEFTGRQVIETSWVSISDGFTCQIRVIDGFTFLKAGFNCGDHVYAMEDGADFMIKLDNDSIITLANLEYSIAKRESIRIGSSNISHFLLSTRYRLTDEFLNELKNNKIVKVRFVTTDGFVERDVSKGNSGKLLKLFNLIK